MAAMSSTVMSFPRGGLSSLPSQPSSCGRSASIPGACFTACFGVVVAAQRVVLAEPVDKHVVEPDGRAVVDQHDLVVGSFGSVGLGGGWSKQTAEYAGLRRAPGLHLDLAEQLALRLRTARTPPQRARRLPLTDTCPAEVLHAIFRVRAGEPILSPSVIRKFIAHLTDTGTDARRHQANPVLAKLTMRERQMAA